MRVYSHTNVEGRVYKEVRGPNGALYLKHRWGKEGSGLGERNRERFGLGESEDDRRRLRNARKAERKAGRR